MDGTTSGTQTLDRGLALLRELTRDPGGERLTGAASRLGLPASTAHRLVARLEAHGLLARIARGIYAAGPALAQPSPLARAAALARPLLRTLALRTGRTAHLGWLEGGMVTYLVKEAPAEARLLTREAMQLEAYCSAIGKVLLAGLPATDRELYLGEGSFVALTERTVTDPHRLRAELRRVACRGWALDEEEIAPGLFCIAVPVPGHPLAISLAGPPPDRAATHLRRPLVVTAGRIAARLAAAAVSPAP